MKKKISNIVPGTVLEPEVMDVQPETVDPQASKNIQAKYSVYRGVAIGLLLFTGAVFYEHKLGLTHREQAFAAVGSANMSTSSPDAILLTINEKRIPRKLYTLSVNNIVQIALAQNLDIKDKAVQQQVQNIALTNVVNTQLLAEKAKSEGMITDMSKVEESFAAVAKSAGTPEKFTEGLKQLGMSREELRTAIGDELLATAYINKTLGSQKIVVSEEELKKAYEQEKSKLTVNGKTPEYKSVKAKLEEMLTNQKRDQLVQEYLNELRKSAKIKFTGA